MRSRNRIRRILAGMFLPVAMVVFSACSQPSGATTVDDLTGAGNASFNILRGGELAELGDTYYYYEPANAFNYGGGLFSSMVDGAGKRRLAQGVISSVNALGDNVYFVRAQKGQALGDLCCVPQAGGAERIIASGCRAALVADGQATYLGAGDALMRLDLSGGAAQTLVPGGVLDYAVDGGSVYYRTADGVYLLGEPANRLVQGGVDAFCEQGGKVYTSVFDQASGQSKISILDASSGVAGGFSFTGRVTALSPYLDALFLCTADGRLLRVKPDGGDPVVYAAGSAVEPCFFADRAFAWSGAKPLALLDDRNVAFDTMDIYGDLSAMTGASLALPILSSEELRQVVEHYGVSSASGEDPAEQYNAEFFKTRALILVLALVQTGSDWTVSSVAFNGVRGMRLPGLVLDVSMDASAAPLADAADCGGCFVSVPKKDLAGVNAAVTVNDVSGAVG